MMGLFISCPILRLSPLTTDDSDGISMRKSRAYQARSDGEVSVVHDVDFGSGRGLKLFVGNTTDPPTDGVLAQISENDGNTYNNMRSVTFHIAQGEYFEVIVFAGTPIIRWRSKGRLLEPINFW